MSGMTQDGTTEPNSRNQALRNANGDMENPGYHVQLTRAGLAAKPACLLLFTHIRHIVHTYVS